MTERCRVVRVDVQENFLDDEVTYFAVCSTGEMFEGASTGAALAAHFFAHLWDEPA